MVPKWSQMVPNMVGSWLCNCLGVSSFQTPIGALPREPLLLTTSDHKNQSCFVCSDYKTLYRDYGEAYLKVHSPARTFRTGDLVHRPEEHASTILGTQNPQAAPLHSGEAFWLCGASHASHNKLAFIASPRGPTSDLQVHGEGGPHFPHLCLL